MMKEENIDRKSGPPTRREGLPFGKEEVFEVIAKVGRDGYADPPTEIAVFPTNRCNLDCYMCHVHHTRRKGGEEMSVERMVTALDTGRLSTLFYLGGEGFAREDFVDILEAFDARGVRQIISTNGTLIDNKTAGRLAALKNLICMQISLNGTRDVDTVVRKSGAAFDKTEAAIRELKALGLPVWVHCVILKENIGNLGDLVSFCGGLEVDMVNFLFGQMMSERDAEETAVIVGKWLAEPVKIGGYVGEIGYSLEQLKSGVAAAKAAGEKSGVQVSFFPRAFGERPDIYWHGTLRCQEQPVCQMVLMPPMTPCISPDGEVYGCPIIDKSFGNVQDTPLDEIWNSRPFLEFRKGLVNDKLMPVCKRCPSADVLL